MNKTKELNQENRKNINLRETIETSAKQTQTTENKENNFSYTVNCSNCQKRKVTIKGNKLHKKHSSKHNLEYYTEKEEDKGKYGCQKCILQLYYQNKTKYGKMVPNLKKRQVLRSYIYLNTLKIKD